MNKKIFFVDFDGTITLEDTCELMANRFCGQSWEAINQRWEDGEMGTIECARVLLNLIQADREDIVDLMRGIPIDPYFEKFAFLVKASGHKLYVLSDGFDLNIRTIFSRNGLNHIEYYANRLTYPAHPLAESGFINEECGKCGTCKSALIAKLKDGESETVYIGDGVSDQCPVHHVDRVFAKKGLFKYCLQVGIPAKSFTTFRDIIDEFYIIAIPLSEPGKLVLY